ncbi:LPD38 domain-containing protein [Muribaculum intestinale]|uniref:LPD38 domain-containing protein n=1 Tax=Muribaculum intestinale TaxID=1796646 RepID=UPI002495394A|nr:LPD38 domain-containing protein [Muribaculum intestinale]
MAKEANESTKWLYEQLKGKGYNVGKDVNEFDSLMRTNADSRQWAYDTATKSGLNVGKDIDEFSSLVGGTSPSSPVDDLSPATTDSTAEVEPTVENKKQEEGWKPTPMQKAFMMGEIQSGVDSTLERMQQSVESTRRLAESRTEEGRNRRKAAEMRARIIGTPTKVLGLTPNTSPATEGNSDTPKGQSNPNSPVVHGIKLEDGVAKTEWMLSDGSLSTSLIDADKAEYGARQARLQYEFIKRMEQNGLNPAKEGDVEKQKQKDLLDSAEKQTRIRLAENEENLHELYDNRAKRLDEQGEWNDDEGFWSNFVRIVGGAANRSVTANAPKPRQYMTAEDKDIGTYLTENQVLTDAKKLLETRKLNKSDGFMGGFWKIGNNWRNLKMGARHALSDADLYVGGVMALQKATQLMDVEEKLKQGTDLTDAEVSLVYSTMLGQDVRDNIETPHGYNAAQITVEMFPFMAQMALNPASGLSRALVTKYGKSGLRKIAMRKAAQGLTGEAAEAFAKKETRKLAAKTVGVQVLGDVAEASVLANTLQAPKTAANAIERYQGNVVEDENGNISFDGSHNWGEAIYKAETSAIIENYTEMLGEHFGIIGNAIGKGVGKGLRAVGGGKIVDAVSDMIGKIGSNEWAKAIGEVEKRAHWNGTVGEVLEEEAGIVLNSIFTGDNKISDLWDADQQIDIVLGVGLFGGFVSGLKTVGYPVAKAKAKGNLRKSNSICSWRFGEDWGEIRSQIENADEKDLGIVIRDLVRTHAKSDEQGKAIVEYAHSLMKARGYEIASATTRAEGTSTPEQQDIEESFEHGEQLVESEDTQAMNDAKKMLDLQRGRLASALSEDLVQDFDNDPIGALSVTHDPELRHIASDYVNAKAVYDGMIQRVRDDVDGRIAQSNAMIDSRINRETGMIQPATMKADDRRVYIVNGTVAMFEDGTGVDTNNSSESIIIRDAETGKVEFADPTQFHSVDEAVDAETEKEAARKQIIDEIAVAAANNIDGVLSFTPGESYSVLDIDGNPEDIAILGQPTDENGIPIDGYVDIQYPDGTIQSVATSDLQQWVDAANTRRVEQFDAERQAERAKYESNSISLQENQSEYGNGSEQNNDERADARQDDGGSVVADTTGIVEGDRDRSDIRVYEEGLATSRDEYSEYSERTRRNSEAERLIGIARQRGQYVDRQKYDGLGERHSKRTGESEVYINKAEGKVYKIKNPAAKSPMKGGVQPEDAIYEHLVHNKYFPETRYQFEGISDDIGDLRIVLSQGYIDAVDNATNEQIEAALAEKGLYPEGNYRYGDNEVSVTDVTGDNALLGADGKVYFIDPIIDFKKPIREIIGDGETDDGVPERTPPSSALSRVPLNENGKPDFGAVDADTAWDAIVEKTSNEAMAQSFADNMVAASEAELKKAEKVKTKPTTDIDEFIAADSERIANIDRAKTALDHWKKVAGTKQRRQAEADAVRSAEMRKRAEDARVKAEQEREEREEAERWEAEKRGLDKRLRDTAESVRHVPEAVEVLKDMNPQSIDEVASWLLSRHKVIWSDTKRGGVRIKYGVASHTGFGEGERRKLFGLFASAEKGGISLDRLSEDLFKEACDVFGVAYDNKSARDALIERIGEARTMGDILNYIANNRIARATRVAAEFDAYEAEQREEHYQESYHMGYDEYEAYEGQMLVEMENAFRNFDEREFYGNIADELVNQQRYGLRSNEEAVGEREVAADGGGVEVLSGTESGEAGGAPGDVVGQEVSGGAGYALRDTSGGLPEGASRGLEGPGGGVVDAGVRISAEDLAKLGERDRREVEDYLSRRWSCDVGVIGDVRDIESLPEDSRADIIDAYEDGETWAIYSRGDKKIYIFAGKNGDESLSGVLLHENVHAVVDMLGDDCREFLESYAGQISALPYTNGVFGGMYADIQDLYAEDKAEEEFLAYSLQYVELYNKVLTKIKKSLDEPTLCYLEDKILSKLYEPAGRTDKGEAVHDNSRVQWSRVQEDNGSREREPHEISGGASGGIRESGWESEAGGQPVGERYESTEEYPGRVAEGKAVQDNSRAQHARVQETVVDTEGGLQGGERRERRELGEGGERRERGDEGIAEEAEIASEEDALNSRIEVKDDDWTEGGGYTPTLKRTIVIDGIHNVTQVDAPNDKGDYTGSIFEYEGKTFGDLREVISYIDSSQPATIGERIAEAEAEVNTTPTDGQKKAGNYKKGHVQVGTFDVTIENPKGSKRSGTDADGKKWETTMAHTYGYIRGTQGVDGDHIDVYISSDIDGWNGRKVFVVDQYNPDGSFDEHKVMLGFNDKGEAFEAYLSNYEAGWEKGRRLDVTAANLDDFEKWIESSKRKTKAFADYKNISKAVSASSQGSVADYKSIKSKEDNNIVGRSLSEQEASDLIARMEMSAEEDPKITLSPESWQNTFGLHNSIATPLGEVKMGEGQYQKFVDKKRSAEFGMAVMTLQDPDLILIEPSEAKDGHDSARPFSYVFVKTFIRDGQKIKYYTSVSVLIDGMEVSVSSHFANKTAIQKKLQEMERAYTKKSLLPNSSEWHLAEHPTDVPDLLPTQEKSETSDDKGNTWSSDKQGGDAKSDEIAADLTDFARRFGEGKGVKAIERELSKWLSERTAEDLVNLDIHMLHSIINAAGLDKGKAWAFRMTIDKAIPKDLLSEVWNLRNRKNGQSESGKRVFSIDGNSEVKQDAYDVAKSLVAAAGIDVVEVGDAEARQMLEGRGEGREEFTNLISNRKPQTSEYRQAQKGNTQSSARTTEAEVSDAKLPHNSQTDKSERGPLTLRTSDGSVYGWTEGGKVYLNRDAMNPETPIHEYTHLWDEMVRRENPRLWERGKELMKQTPLWEEVADDPNYADIGNDENAIASEVHSRLTGKRGAERIEKMMSDAAAEPDMVEKAKKFSILHQLKRWLQDMFKGLKKTLSKWTKRDLRNLTTEDFADLTLRDLADGLNPKHGDKNLVAVHNLSVDKLKEAMELGGFPMPSIAITKTGVGHSSFGEISLVFGKDSIDPAHRRNKVYSGDAWTPTFPSMGYKLNSERTSDIYKRANKAQDMGLPMFRAVDFHPDNYERRIDGRGDGSLVEAFKDDYGAKQLFLYERGNPVEKYEKNEVEKYSPEKISLFEKVLNVIGEDRLRNDDYETLEPEIKRIVSAHQGKDLDLMKPLVARSLVSGTIRKALDYADNGNTRTETDIAATQAKIDDRVDPKEYQAWLEEMFAGVVEKKGIRNNRDMFTPSGESRNWESLYDAVTLYNVVKAMQKQAQKGGEGFFGGSIFGASTKEIKDIEKLRMEAEERIKAAPQEEYDAEKKRIEARLEKVSVPSASSSFSDMMDFVDNVKEAVVKSHTADGIYRHLRKLYPDMTIGVAEEIADIVKDIQKMSTRYLEAKPQRAVGFEEVRLAVVPAETPREIIAGLKSHGVPVRIYERGNEQQRSTIISQETSDRDLRFHAAMSRGREAFDELRDRAMAERGIVMPGLNEKEVRVVEVPRHDFEGTGKQALQVAEKWAKENIVGIHTVTDSRGDGFEYSISKDAVEKYVSRSATAKSDNIGVHLAALKKLPEIISESIEAEVHPDYKKQDAKRTAQNEVNEEALIHRFYGAINIEGKAFRVKTTMREYLDKKRLPLAHSYEITQIELLAAPSDGVVSDSGEPLAMTPNSSIPAAKLLKGVEKSYEPGVKLLDASGKKSGISNDILSRYKLEEKGAKYAEMDADVEVATDITLSEEDSEETEDEELLRDGYGAYSDAEVSMENDPWSKAWGESIRTKRQQRQFAERERERMRDRAKSLSSVLGIDIEVIEDASSLKGKKQRAKGWYDTKTGKITVVVGNHNSAADMEATILHEAVAHHGLRQLLGEHFDEFLDKVYEAAENGIKEQIDLLASRNGWNRRVATEEYLAGLAEETEFDRAEERVGGWFDKIKRFFIDMLFKAGFKHIKPGSIGDNELRYILWRSYQNLAHPGRYRAFEWEAEDVAMQYKLQVGEYGHREEATEEKVAEAGELYELNERFNRELEMQIDGTLPAGHVYNMGMPSKELLSTGIARLPIRLSASVLNVKSNLERHAYDLSSVRNLVNAIQKPWAIFSYGDKGKAQNLIIGIEDGGRQFLVGISINPTVKGVTLEINSIRNVFPKNNHEWINWINEGKLLRVDGKKEIQAIIAKLRMNPVAFDYVDLDNATKIVENFENPTIGEQNNNNGGEDTVLFRDGDFTPRDRKLAADVYEKMLSRGSWQFREATQDSMLGLKTLYESILGSNTRIENVAGYENAYLYENRMSSANNGEQHQYFSRFMKPLLDSIHKLCGSKELDRRILTDYMMAKHGLERNEYMRNEAAANGEDTERDFAGLCGLTGEDDWQVAETVAQQMVDDYESDHDTAELWDNVKKATNATLEKIYLSGLISEDTYNKVLGMYDFYIPLRGWDETTSDEVYGYLTSKDGPLIGNVFKKAGGRNSKADDPIATIAMMADDAIRQGNRNIMKQRFLNFVHGNPSDLVSVNEMWLQHNDVTDEWEPVFADLQPDMTHAEVESEIAKFEAKMEALRTAEPDKYKKGGDARNIPYKVVRGNLNEHQVLVKRNGRTYVMTINGNPRAAQALNGLTNPDTDMGGVYGKIIKVASYVNRQLSAFYTTRNPGFVVSNFLRDMLYSNCMTWVKENPRYALRFHKNFGKVNPLTLRKLLSKWENDNLSDSNYLEKMFKEFMLNGGETGYTSVKDIDGHKRTIAKELKKISKRDVGHKTWYWLGGQLDLLNRSVENCARFAAFVTSREMGRTLDRSIYDAKEVSVNFNKKGSGDRFVDANGQTALGKTGGYLGGVGRSLYVFWTAGIQGMTNFGRAGVRNPKKAIGGAAALFTLGYVIPLLAQMLGGGDGDDDDKNAYYNLPEYVRRSNICFKAGEQWITIPLPIEYRAIYGMGELACGVISGNERYSNSELAYYIAAQVSQVMPLDFLEGANPTSHDGFSAESLTHPFIPSAFKPFTEAYIMNKGWTGLPIYKDTPYNKNDPEWTKAYQSADQHLVAFTRWLNETSGGDDYKKGAIDINPAKLEYLLSGTFGGAVSTTGKLKKMGETALGTREFEWRNMLLANRVIKSGDERTANRKLQNEYFRYLTEYEETNRLRKKYENAADDGILGYAERVDFLYNSPEYLRFGIFEKYKSDIDAIREEIKEETNPEAKKELQEELFSTMRELVDELHDVGK